MSTCERYNVMNATAAKKQRIRGKHWCATINNLVDEDYSQFADIEEFTTYYVYGKETGDSGNFHLQCYIAFKRVTDLSKLKQMWPRGHFELMACKRPKTAADYCKKGCQSHEEWSKLGINGPNYGLRASFLEYGTVPESQGEKGAKATKDMWAGVIDSALKGEFENILPNILIPHYSQIKKFHFDNQLPLFLVNELRNEWIWGEPGIGKSRRAREENPSLYDKMLNKWWDGYEGERTVLLDDFEIEHKIFGHHLKRWCDHYSFPAEIKNHVKQIRPDKIVVTSNYHPNEIWEGAMLEAILRRFKVIKMERLNNFDNTISKKRNLKIINAPVKEAIKRPKLYKEPGTITYNQTKVDTNFTPMKREDSEPFLGIKVSSDDVSLYDTQVITTESYSSTEEEGTEEGTEETDSSSSESDESSESFHTTGSHWFREAPKDDE